MKKFYRFLFLIIVSFTMFQCETNFDVIADYKEVSIVYGLLNQNDSVHYLRVNKAFLGDGNALSYAQVADSSSYGADISVVLTETTPAGIHKEIVFDTVTLSVKQPGDFYYPNQLYYYSDAVLNQENTYSLKIINKKTLNEVSAQTRLIHNFAYTKPAQFAKTLNFSRSITLPNKFIWANAVNGKRYQLCFYFNFKELNAAGDTTYRKIDWLFPEIITEEYDGIGTSEVSYLNEDFYTLCENKIPYSDPTAEALVVSRISSVCDLVVTAIGDEYNTYLEANAPSTGVLIDKPVYSNITNGLGLLSCRYQIHLPKPLPLSAETIVDLSKITSLKFEKQK
jgi:hypothetical protein